MSRGTILLVDDSPLTIETVRRGLEATGFAVRHATDLADIPRSLGKSDIDLVLMDVEMAEAFGDDLAVVLADDAAGPPIYLLSALEDAELSERAEAAGVQGYIAKREGVCQVVRRVESILGAATAPMPASVSDEMMPIFVETAARRACRARAALRAGGSDDLRRAAYELHALVGEAAVLGFAELAALAQEGRRLAASCGEQLDRRRECEDLLSLLEERVRTIAAEAGTLRGTEARRTAADAASSRRVLLLDDSDVYRAVLRAILEDSGFLVTEAASCVECRERLHDEPFALVVFDVELHDGSGIDLIPEVKRAMPDVPLVVLTGGDMFTLPDGADLTLLKTLDPTSLVIKLERLLAGPRGATR